MTDQPEKKPQQRGPELNNNNPNNSFWDRGGKIFAFWVVFFLVAMLIFSNSQQMNRAIEIPYSMFYAQMEAGNIQSVDITDREFRGKFSNPITVGSGDLAQSVNMFKTRIPYNDPDLVKEMQLKGIHIEVKEPSVWMQLLISALPWVLIIFVWVFLIRQMQGGSGAGKIFSFAKSRAKLMTEDRPKITFKDVAGVDEAEEELVEIIEFLKDPNKFTKLGGKIPKGVLLVGPPGTGKTLLAKAVAGEAKVPFFQMSGSEFVEMFVGVGAARVRDLFEQGKRNSPCIIFIDEIDAVGRHRGAGLGGGHDEREQTLNQLLVEMDGFNSNDGVIIISATNRPDVLDPALLRPGRFDRQVVVDRPDVKGREEILKVHTRTLTLDEDVDLAILARGTPGLVGADLANLVNEAALLAARRDHQGISMLDLEDAKDRALLGIERKSLIISDEEKLTTAYHESGHVLVAKMIPESDPILKVTIIPRGRALGVTFSLPEDDRHNYSKKYCEAVLAKAMGGRAAEEIVFDNFSTGAGKDIEQSTELARRMVCEWGMSEKIGPLNLGPKAQEIFLGREIQSHQDFSEKTAQLIDDEIKHFIVSAYDKAKKIIADNREKLDKLAKVLLERELLNSDEIEMLLNGHELPPLKPVISNG